MNKNNIIYFLNKSIHPNEPTNEAAKVLNDILTRIDNVVHDCNKPKLERC